MNREIKRKRSKSHKRKRTISGDRSGDESMLLKMLDERAQTKKKLLISKEELYKLKDSRNLLQSLQIQYETEKKQWQSESASLKSSKIMLQQENQDLMRKNQELLEKISYYEHINSENPADHQVNLSKIKESLINLESLVAYRSQTSNRFILKIHKLLAKHAKLLLDQPLTNTNKSKLTTGIRKISQSVTAIQNLLVSPKTLVQEPEDLNEVYKAALEKMKSQTILLREKLKELENGDGLKKIIEDQDLKIEMLTKEKSLLKAHIEHLQNSMTDQMDLIQGLKEKLKKKNKESLKNSPHKIEENYKSYIDHDEKDLQAEIANLDNEIQNLQNSLKRALINH